MRSDSIERSYSGLLSSQRLVAEHYCGSPFAVAGLLDELAERIQNEANKNDRSAMSVLLRAADRRLREADEGRSPTDRANGRISEELQGLVREEARKLELGPIFFATKLGQFKTNLQRVLLGLAGFSNGLIHPVPPDRRGQLRGFVERECAIDLAIAELRAQQARLCAEHDALAMGAAQQRRGTREALARARYGLSKAAQHYNPARGYRFFSYAPHWIEHAMGVEKVPPHCYPQDEVGEVLAQLEASGVPLLRMQPLEFECGYATEIARERMETLLAPMADRVEVRRHDRAVVSSFRLVALHATVSAYASAVSDVAHFCGGSFRHWQPSIRLRP